MGIRSNLKSGVSPHPLATDPATAGNRRTFTQDRDESRWSMALPTLTRWANQPVRDMGFPISGRTQLVKSGLSPYKWNWHVTVTPADSVGHGVCYGPTGAGMMTTLMTYLTDRTIRQ